MTVYVGQFVKNELYNETGMTKFCKHVTIEQLGNGCFIDREPNLQDFAAARAGLQHVAQLMANGVYDMVVLDELCIALNYGLVDIAEVIEVLNNKAFGTEVVITGRNAPSQLIDYADLVTEMSEIKHYYKEGVLSRNGFDC